MGVELKPMAADELAALQMRETGSTARRVVDADLLYIDSVRVGEILKRSTERRRSRFHAVIGVSNGLAQGHGESQQLAIEDAFESSVASGRQYMARLRKLACAAGVSLPAEPVLMSAENPSGFKLEELLATLQNEVTAKHQKIVSDDSEVSRHVQANNLKILVCLAEAERLQRDSYARLSEIAADAGPEGVARIGIDLCESCNRSGPTVKHGGQNLCSVCEIADVSERNQEAG